jgi:hypothetical protein
MRPLPVPCVSISNSLAYCLAWHSRVTPQTLRRCAACTGRLLRVCGGLKGMRGGPSQLRTTSRYVGPHCLLTISSAVPQLRLMGVCAMPWLKNESGCACSGMLNLKCCWGTTPRKAKEGSPTPGPPSVLPALAHRPQGAVMRRYREMVHTATLTSFNPMVDDFLNTRFFMGDALGRKSSSAPRPPGSRSSTGSGSKAGADEAGQAAQSSGWGLGSWRGAWGGGKSGNTSKQPPSSTGGGGASSTPGGPPAGGAQHQKQQQQQQQQGSLKGQVWGLQQGASQDPPGPQGPKPDILGGGRIGGRQEQRQRQRQLGKGPDLSALPDWARQRLLEKQRKQGQQQQGPGQRQQQGQWEPPAHQQPAVQQGLSEAQQVSGEQQALSQQRQQRQAQQQQPSQGDPVGPGIKRPNG